MNQNIAEYMFGVVGNTHMVDRVAFWTAMSTCIGFISAVIDI